MDDNQQSPLIKSGALPASTASHAGMRHSPPDHGLHAVFPKWLRVARQWFTGDERWLARGYTASTVLLSLVTTLLLVQVSYAQRNLQTAMSSKDEAGFYKAVWQFVGIIVLAAPLFALTDWLEARLVLEWRRWLSRELLTRYFAQRAFFLLTLQTDSIDNPDQRICDDVPAFADSSVVLVHGLVRKLFNCVAFAGVLWRVAPKLVLFLLAYAALGTWATTSLFGRRLMRLQYTVLQREGDLRYDLIRTRENAEAIAFYGGEAKEAATAKGRLAVLMAVLRRRIAWSAGLSLWTNSYSYATMLLPSLLTAPRYFAGEVEFGVISQVGFSFYRIETALSLIITQLGKISGLAAQTERLDALIQELWRPRRSTSSIARLPAKTGSLALEGLSVQTPNGAQQLCRGLDVQLAPGQSLLIVGPSGCGKSSMLRAISGLWTRGSGAVHCPDPGDMFFLPQQPFMPLGNLRQQLLFPSGDSGATRAGLRSGPEVTDQELLDLLDFACLQGLAERVGGLYAEAQWAQVLSLGEQQRCAWARLLLHRPMLAFLDEGTSALDSATEAKLYAALRSVCPSYVSVGHRMELLQYHTHVLEHVGAGGWHMHTAQEYLQELSPKKFGV